MRHFTHPFAIFGQAGRSGSNSEKSCKSCRGADGAGNPAIAKVMKVELRALGSAEVQASPDADLKAAVTKTGKSLDDVVAYVRSLKK